MHSNYRLPLTRHRLVFVVLFATNAQERVRTCHQPAWLHLADRMRAIALGLCTAVHWIANFVVSLLFPQLAQSVGLGWIYGGFAFFALVSFLFVRTLVPETKGMELEQMQGDTARTLAQV